MTPQRIQLSRRKGWRKPEGAIVVARPSKWGNPFKVGAGLTRQQAVDLFRLHIGPMRTHEPDDFDAWIAPLRGHDLGCWCPIGQPCHADVLLELANR